MVILRALLGLAFFLFVAWLLSTNKRRINWRVVIAGILMQVLLAVVILKTDTGSNGLRWVSDGVTKFLSFSNKGAEFVFGPLTQFEPAPDENGTTQPVNFYPHFMYDAEGQDHLAESSRSSWPIVFAFRALPTIIFFSAFMAILYHLGIIQALVRLMARFMMWALRVSGAESLAMAANVFVGQTEAPLVIKPYINGMTRSELNALMTGGFATIAGSVLAAYIGFIGPKFAGHLLAASFMSAPAAFVIAKLMVPETEESETRGKVSLDVPRTTTNLVDAAATGTADGLKLALNVCAMLIAFIALVALIDWPLKAMSDGDVTLRSIFGTVFAPVAWMMGVPWDDCNTFGSLLGTKIVVNEFVAFGNLQEVGAGMSDKAQIMAAYALCGFANFASIGIQLGGIGPLAPGRRKDLSQLALRAMLGGAFASWMTATIAGAFLG
ncbi:MAG: NupC/NupG family nucleoside CNT transporter [Planctomycetes bacterium]|nr:NupC/NupG family nucleoside CNT transporter [Planctomycetota bacterium]